MNKEDVKSIEDLWTKMVGKEASEIVTKVDGMLKKGEPRAKIEEAIVKELNAFAKGMINQQRMAFPPIVV